MTPPNTDGLVGVALVVGFALGALLMYVLLHATLQRWADQNAALMKALLDMRRDGFAPVHKATVRAGAIDAEAVGLERAETAELAGRRKRAERQAFLTRAVQDLRAAQPKANERDLVAEANRLFQELREDGDLT